MDNKLYEKIIKEGERVDWYGSTVPKDLITQSVLTWSEGLIREIDKLEAELNEIKGSSADKKRHYIEALRNNLRNSPYKLNGDFYLKKKNRFEEEVENSKPKKGKTKTTKTTTKRSKTKNSELIFSKTNK